MRVSHNENERTDPQFGIVFQFCASLGTLLAQHSASFSASLAAALHSLAPVVE